MLSIIKKKPGADGCNNIDDIRQRYERLDELIEYLRLGGTFKEGTGFRESGGVYIHIGREGEMIFAGGGCHRLAIAQKLNLKEIPAQLGVVHRDFVASGGFKRLAKGYLRKCEAV